METLDKEILRPIHLDDGEADPFDMPEGDDELDLDEKKKKGIEEDEEAIEDEDEDDAAPEPAFDDEEDSF